MLFFPDQVQRWRDASGPLYVALSQEIITLIRAGALVPGQRLPSTRALATQLGLNRNTVVLAYDELSAQGWLEQRRGSGAYVCAALELSVQRANTPRQAAGAGFELSALPSGLERLVYERAEQPPKALRMGGGEPDPRLMPGELLARAYREVLRVRPQEVLSYGEPLGYEGLRRLLIENLRQRRGISAGLDELMLTQGSQQGLSLLAQALIKPGDVVAVEALGYQPAFGVLRAHGARLIGLEVDEQGAQVERLEALHAQHKLRAVYLTPHHQYPTTVTLSAARRLMLLRWAAAHRVAIIEDDYDHEFHFEGQPVAALKSADAHGVVCYVGTFSKVLAPGLRKGYVVAPAPVIARLAQLRLLADRQGDRVTEAALASLMEEGALERHIRKVQRVYAQRREALLRSLHRRFGALLSSQQPRGGMALWVRVEDARVDVPAWTRRAAGLGVWVSPGAWFALDGSPEQAATQALRIGFATCDIAQLELGVSRLRAAYDDSPTRD